MKTRTAVDYFCGANIRPMETAFARGGEEKAQAYVKGIYRQSLDEAAIITLPYGGSIRIPPSVRAGCDASP